MNADRSFEVPVGVEDARNAWNVGRDLTVANLDEAVERWPPLEIAGMDDLSTASAEDRNRRAPAPNAEQDSSRDAGDRGSPVARASQGEQALPFRPGGVRQASALADQSIDDCLP
jgi:hypothetical protein